MDGWIRIWFYQTIEEANSHSEEYFLEMQPVYEYHVSEDDETGSSMLMCIRKQEPDNPESTSWYAQVGNKFSVAILINLNKFMKKICTNIQSPEDIEISNEII